MDYYIFRINQSFRGLIDEDLLGAILEKDHGAFFERQLAAIIEPIPWSKMVQIAKNYFKGRNDVHINEFSFTWQSLFSGQHDELWALNNCLRLHQENDESPFRTFLEEFDEDWVYVANERVMSIG